MPHNKLLIFGGKGMLGTDIAAVFQNDYEVIVLDQTDVDITQSEQVEKIIQHHQPSIIINCAAFTAVDRCETEAELAMQVNGYALKNIVESAKKVGAKIVHFSTDYVFDGTKKEGYSEDDSKNPLSVYGQSKSLGEDILLHTYPEKSYIIRTAWLYGKHGKNFVQTMLDLAAKGEPLKVVQDQIGSPTHTVDLALAVREMLKKDVPAGIYHVTNSGSCSWYDFAREIFQLQNIQVVIQPVTTSKFPRPAKRPAYSILRNTKLPALRNWQKALADFLEND